MSDIEENCVAENAQQQIEQEENSEAIASKFKNPQELEKAYKELEKEFTRRSQMLAKLKDEMEKKEAVKTDEKDWEQIVDKFFAETPAAKPFAKDIAVELSIQPELKHGDDPLGKALTRVMLKKFRTPEDFANDGEFLNEYIIPSPTVQKAVIERYIKDLQTGKSPVLMTDNGISPITPSKRPRTLEEAGAMFAKNNK